MGVITRVGSLPGVRRFVRKAQTPGQSWESPDDEERDPRWCAQCRREVLFDMARCPDCGGEPVTAIELARRSGTLPSSPEAGPSNWRLNG